MSNVQGGECSANGKRQQQQHQLQADSIFGIVKLQKILPRDWKLAKGGGLFEPGFGEDPTKGT